MEDLLLMPFYLNTNPLVSYHLARVILSALPIKNAFIIVVVTVSFIEYAKAFTAPKNKISNTAPSPIFYIKALTCLAKSFFTSGFFSNLYNLSNVPCNHLVE